MLTLPWAQGPLDNGYPPPDAPLFSSPEVTYITVRSAFRRMLGHRIRNKGEGREGHEEPPNGHATVQNAQKYPFSGFDQQRIASASPRIQTFAGHQIATVMVRI